jgi:hypothetical protein
MRRVRVLAALLALGLGACDGPSSTITDMRVDNAMQLLRYAAGQGPVLVEIAGDPHLGQARFDPAAFLALVAEAYQPVSNPPLTFTLDKARAGDAGYRFVWLIDPGPGFTIDGTCAGQGQPGVAKKADWVEMRAVFCAPNKTISAVYGRTRRPKAADDAGWRHLVRQMSRQLVGERMQG